MAERCVSCHSQALKGGELDLSSYEATMAGGHSDPAVVPGEVQTSLLVSRQVGGGHAGQSSQEELQQVMLRIETGALVE